MQEGEREVDHHITNYALVTYKPNKNDKKKNNDMQIGFRIDTTPVEVSSDENILIDIYSETDSRWFGGFSARGKKTMDIVRYHDKDDPIMLYHLQELREYTNHSDDIDLKKLFNNKENVKVLSATPCN